MKLFLKILILVFLIDIALGFSMTYFVGNKEPSIFIHFIDEIISFPTALWNRLFPENGIYRATTNSFWLVVIFNAIIQALVIFGIIYLIKKQREK